MFNYALLISEWRNWNSGRSIRLQNNWEGIGRGLVEQFAWNGWGQPWKRSPE